MTPTQRRTAIECRSLLSYCAALIDEVLRHPEEDENAAHLLSSVPGTLLGPDGVAAKIERLFGELLVPPDEQS